MLLRSLAPWLLSLALALAVPLAVAAWLAGAHVTPEQTYSHARAVAQYGAHQHTPPVHPADDWLPSVALPSLPTVDGVSDPVLAAASPFLPFSFWPALLTILLAQAALPACGARPRAPARRLPGHVPDVLPPPPRSPRLVPA